MSFMTGDFYENSRNGLVIIVSVTGGESNSNDMMDEGQAWQTLEKVYSGNYKLIFLYILVVGQTT